MGFTGSLIGGKAVYDIAYKIPKEQEEAAKRAEEEQRRLRQEFEAEQKRLKTEKDNAAKLESDKQRRRAAGATGRSDTILTGPLGLGSNPAGASGTLLGR